MSAHLFVSIIITSYNYGRFLKSTIDSALQQTYSHIEVIVVDDGSTDNSADIIREYGNKVIAILKENAGQASSFNTGFSQCKGDVIIFLDSDDLILSTAVENIVKKFEGPHVSKVHWPLYKIDVDGNKTAELVPVNLLAEGNLLADVVKDGPEHKACFTQCPPTSGNAWSRRFLQKVLPMPEEGYKTCPDYYLTVLAPVYGEIRKLAEPYGCYRIHGNNYSLKPLEDYMKENLLRYEQCSEVLEQHLARFGIQVNPSAWPRKSWFHLINDSVKEIETIVPAEGSFILVDGDELRTSNTVAGRKKLPFTEKGGIYWGPPANDDAAISEIERQRQVGACSIVFAWTAFWYLDHYTGMCEHLNSKYKCQLKNERIVVFDLLTGEK
jgi:hypothetical protein